eukprot:gene5667-5904_t
MACAALVGGSLVLYSAAAAQATWVKLNPGLNLTLHNDSTAAEFIKHFFGPEVSEVYQSFPLGVMRSDFWRYADSPAQILSAGHEWRQEFVQHQLLVSPPE